MDILGIDIGTVSVKYARMRDKGAAVSQGEHPHKGGRENLNFVLIEVKDREKTDMQAAKAVTSRDIIKKTLTIPIMPTEKAKETIERLVSNVMLQHLNIPEEAALYPDKNCPACEYTSHKGRTGVFEALVMDDAIHELVIGENSGNILKKTTAETGEWPCTTTRSRRRFRHNNPSKQPRM